MVELFSDIPQELRQYAETMFNFALMYDSVDAAAHFLNDCVQNFEDDYAQDFLNFYFNMRLEALMNESSNSER